MSITPHTTTTRTLATGLVVALGLGAALYGGSALTRADASSSDTPDVPRQAIAEAVSTPGSSHGRHLGSIAGAYVAPGEISFDAVDFFVGRDAIVAATADGVNRADIGDHYIRNSDPMTISLPVANDVIVTVVECSDGGCVEGVPMGYDSFTIEFDERGMYWVTVEDGFVVRIDEQYLP